MPGGGRRGRESCGQQPARAGRRGRGGRWGRAGWGRGRDGGGGEGARGGEASGLHSVLAGRRHMLVSPGAALPAPHARWLGVVVVFCCCLGFISFIVVVDCVVVDCVVVDCVVGGFFCFC